MFVKFKDFVEVTESVEFISNLSEQKRNFLSKDQKTIILKYINENQPVSKSQLQRFLVSLHEETNSPRITWKTLRKYNNLIDTSFNESTNEISYWLTQRGETFISDNYDLNESELNEKEVDDDNYIQNDNEDDEIIKTVGKLKIPDGQKVTDLDLDHFKLLIDQGNKSEVLKDLLNLYTWNIKKDPKLSGWAKKMRDMVRDLKESFDNRTEQYVLYLESSIDEDRKEEYQEFFKKKLKDYGVDSPADLSEEEKKKFFNEISDEWK